MTATAAPPTTPKEWEDYVHGFDTPEAFQTAFADGTFQDNLTAYVSSQNKVMDDLRAATNEQVQLAVHEMLKNGGATDTGTATNRLDLVMRARHDHSANGVLNSVNAPGYGLNGEFSSPGEAFQAAAAALGIRSMAGVDRTKVDNLKAYSEKVPSEGGILVPEEWRSDILTRALEMSIVRPAATVIPLTTGKLKYPAVDMTTEVGEVYGGMVFAWTDEGGTIAPSDATFAAVALEANKLTGGALIPNELLRDAPALTVWLRTNMPNGWAHFEDLGFLKGNGVKKPLGQLHADNPSLITITKEVGQPAASFTWNNALAMLSRLLPECFDRAQWIITPDALPEIFTMALPVGTGGSAVMFAEGGGSQRLPMNLLGLPIRWSRKAPGVLGTKGDVSLTDLSTYLIGDTMDMRIDTSEHAAFWTDKTGFRVVGRVDGQPSHLSALTPENGGPTLSATVQIETRS